MEGGDGVPLRRRALRRGGALHFGVLETSAGTCGVSGLSAAAPALAGSPNSEVPFLRATPGWLHITSGDGAQALLWPTCLL